MDADKSLKSLSDLSAKELEFIRIFLKSPDRTPNLSEVMRAAGFRSGSKRSLEKRASLLVRRVTNGDPMLFQSLINQTVTDVDLAKRLAELSMSGNGQTALAAIKIILEIKGHLGEHPTNDAATIMINVAPSQDQTGQKKFNPVSLDLDVIPDQSRKNAL